MQRMRETADSRSLPLDWTVRRLLLSIGSRGLPDERQKQRQQQQQPTVVVAVVFNEKRKAPALLPARSLFFYHLIFKKLMYTVNSVTDDR